MLYGAGSMRADAVEEWTRVAELSFPLARGATVTAAELEACVWGVSYLVGLLNDPHTAHFHSEIWQPLDTSALRLPTLAGLPT